MQPLIKYSSWNSLRLWIWKVKNISINKIIGLIGFNFLKNARGICSRSCRHCGLRNTKLAFFNKNSEPPLSHLDWKIFQWNTNKMWTTLAFLFLILTRGLSYFFRNSRREGGGERERETSMWETHIYLLPAVWAPTGAGINPATQISAIDQKSNLWPCGVGWTF